MNATHALPVPHKFRQSSPYPRDRKQNCIGVFCVTFDASVSYLLMIPVQLARHIQHVTSHVFLYLLYYRLKKKPPPQKNPKTNQTKNLNNNNIVNLH